MEITGLCHFPAQLTLTAKKNNHFFVKTLLENHPKTSHRLKCATRAESEMMMRLIYKDFITEEDEVKGLKKFTEKCKVIGGGVVELLECLEDEAISGEDQGTEPMDYNRRAKIFYTSSLVFQALKQDSSD